MILSFPFMIASVNTTTTKKEAAARFRTFTSFVLLILNYNFQLTLSFHRFIFYAQIKN